MILTEWNQDDYVAVQRAEAREEGERRGEARREVRREARKRKQRKYYGTLMEVAL
jgi:hypothetical protein